MYFFIARLLTDDCARKDKMTMTSLNDVLFNKVNMKTLNSFSPDERLSFHLH